MEPAGQPRLLRSATARLVGAGLLGAPGVAAALRRTLLPGDLVALRSAGRAGRRAANAAIETMEVRVDPKCPPSKNANPDDAALFGTTGGAPFSSLRALTVAGRVRPPALAKLLAALPTVAPALRKLDLRGATLGAAAAAPKVPRPAAGAASAQETLPQALARAGGELTARAATRAALAPLLAPLARTLESLKLDRAWLVAPAAAALAAALEAGGGGGSGAGGGPTLGLKGEVTPAALEGLSPLLLRRLHKLSVRTMRGDLKYLGSYGTAARVPGIVAACLGGEPTEESPPSALAALLGGAISLRSLELRQLALSAAQLRAIGEAGAGGRLRTLRIELERDYGSSASKRENLAAALAAFPRLRRVRLDGLLPADHYGYREATPAAFPIADVLAALPLLERLETPSVDEAGYYTPAKIAALLALAPPASLTELGVFCAETSFEGSSSAVVQAALGLAGGAPAWAAKIRRLRVGRTSDDILPLLALATGLTHLSLAGRACDNHSDWCVEEGGRGRRVRRRRRPDVRAIGAAAALSGPRFSTLATLLLAGPRSDMDSEPLTISVFLTVAALIKTLAPAMGGTLRVLCLDDVIFEDEDAAALVAAFPRLEELKLARARSLGGPAPRAAARHL